MQFRNEADRGFETRVTDFIAGLAPWLSPVPTAYLVARATVEYLEWPLPVAIVAAAIVESLGLSTTATALQLRAFNRSKRKTDPAAPFSLAAVLVLGYFLVATGLTVMLDIYPNMARVAPAIFPGLSLAGVATLALRADHQARLKAIAQEKAERKALRQTQQQERKANVTPNTQSVTPDVSPYANPDTRRQALRAALLERKDLTPTEAAKMFGVSRAAIYNDLDRLETAGQIRRNGNGLEVF